MADEAQKAHDVQDVDAEVDKALSSPSLEAYAFTTMRAHFYNVEMTARATPHQVVVPEFADFKALRVLSDGVVVMRPQHLAAGTPGGAGLLECRRVTVLDPIPGMDRKAFFIPAFLLRPYDEPVGQFPDHLKAVMGDEDGLFPAPRLCWAAWAETAVICKENVVGLCNEDLAPPPSPIRDQSALVGATADMPRAAGTVVSLGSASGGRPTRAAELLRQLPGKPVELGVTAAQLKVMGGPVWSDQLMQSVYKEDVIRGRYPDLIRLAIPEDIKLAIPVDIKMAIPEDIKLAIPVDIKLAVPEDIYGCEKRPEVSVGFAVGQLKCGVLPGQLQEGKHFLVDVGKEWSRMLPGGMFGEQLGQLLKNSGSSWMTGKAATEGLKEACQELWKELAKELKETAGRQDLLSKFAWVMEDTLVEFLKNFYDGIGSGNKEVGPWSREKLARPTMGNYLDNEGRRFAGFVVEHWGEHMGRMQALVVRASTVFGALLDEVSAAHGKMTERMAMLRMLQGAGGRGGHQGGGYQGGAGEGPRGNGGPLKRQREANPDFFLLEQFVTAKVRGHGAHRRCMQHCKHMIKGARPCSEGGPGARCRWGHHDLLNRRAGVEFFNTWARENRMPELPLPGQ